MSIFLMTPHEVAIHIAKQAQAKRLALNLSQKTLAQRSGVSYGTLKKFERSGQISLESLLKIALTLGVMETFEDLFPHLRSEQVISLDQLINDKPRKRGRT
ncbi:MAG: family transcriptional regulator [Gammaproteobacteria bacterium]|jgi:transcriptional regulator with XRE-family HTH domain|nr:family transcriptional regulator [Gammaproteobacteria bacterium]